MDIRFWIEIGFWGEVVCGRRACPRMLSPLKLSCCGGGREAPIRLSEPAIVGNLNYLPIA